jgi:Fe-S-cluster-containing dehydrogenase component
VSPRQPLPVLAESAEADLAPDRHEPGLDPERRAFLRTAAAGAALASLAGCQGSSMEDFFRKHFRELTPAELKRILAKVEASNNQSRLHPQIHWIRVLEMDKEHGVDLTHAEHYYDPATVPQPGKFYFPVQCQQCRNPPCVKACPTQATWKERDGIVVIDYDWCIGCRCCMSACPYGARHFNLAEPTLPAAELNPSQHFLGNRPRPKGVVEKCTFCIQRSRNGRYTACVEACPVGARKFGNLLDPDSEIRRVMETKRVFVFKEELATHPQFYYFYAT